MGKRLVGALDHKANLLSVQILLHGLRGGCTSYIFGLVSRPQRSHMGFAACRNGPFKIQGQLLGARRSSLEGFGVSKGIGRCKSGLWYTFQIDYATY